MKKLNVQPTSFQNLSIFFIILLIVSSGCLSSNQWDAVKYCALDTPDYDYVMCQRARDRAKEDKEREARAEKQRSKRELAFRNRSTSDAWNSVIYYANYNAERNPSTLYPELAWLNGSWCERYQAPYLVKVIKILSKDRIEMKYIKTDVYGAFVIESMNFTLRATNDGYYELIADGKVTRQPGGIHDKIRLNNQEGFTFIDYIKYSKKGISGEYVRCSGSIRRLDEEYYE